jgi:hypothetical protein
VGPSEAAKFREAGAAAGIAAAEAPAAEVPAAEVPAAEVLLRVHALAGAGPVAVQPAPFASRSVALSGLAAACGDACRVGSAGARPESAAERALSGEPARAARAEAALTLGLDRAVGVARIGRFALRIDGRAWGGAAEAAAPPPPPLRTAWLPTEVHFGVPLAAGAAVRAEACARLAEAARAEGGLPALASSLAPVDAALEAFVARHASGRGAARAAALRALSDGDDAVALAALDALSTPARGNFGPSPEGARESADRDRGRAPRPTESLVWDGSALRRGLVEAGLGPTAARAAAHADLVDAARALAVGEAPLGGADDRGARFGPPERARDGDAVVLAGPKDAWSADAGAGGTRGGASTVRRTDSGATAAALQSCLPMRELMLPAATPRSRARHADVPVAVAVPLRKR